MNYFELTLEGLTPMRTTFETEKEKIRNLLGYEGVS